ncbi:MAG: signal peptidase I [Prevotella pectinovora]
MNNSLKKIWNVISSILVALVVLLALLLVGARVVGLQVFTVLSGSMEPTYHTGSLIYVKKVDPYTIKEGQPITFMLDENTVATHRVVGIVPDEEDPTVIRFRTKGDANDAEDGGLVHYKNVIGTPVFTIPKLGYLANYVQHPPGMYVAISAGAVLLLLVFIPDIFADDDKKKKAGARKKGVRTTSRKDADFDPNEPVPAEQAEKMAEDMLRGRKRCFRKKSFRRWMRDWRKGLSRGANTGRFADA